MLCFKVTASTLLGEVEPLDSHLVLHQKVKQDFPWIHFILQSCEYLLLGDFDIIHIVLAKMHRNRLMSQNRNCNFLWVIDDTRLLMKVMMMMLMKRVSWSRHKRRNVVGKREHQPALLMENNDDDDGGKDDKMMMIMMVVMMTSWGKEWFWKWQFL